MMEHASIGGSNNGVTTPSLSRCRVLFLRSHGKVPLCSIIANGLRTSQKIDFAQYPPLPSGARSKLSSDTEWQELQINLITTYQEVAGKLFGGYFDLVLLADNNSHLFRHTQKGPRQKIDRWRTLFYNCRKKGVSDALEWYRYLRALPLSVKEICRAAPLVVVDLWNAPYLPDRDIHLLQDCFLYFKRGIPYNRFALYRPFREKPYQADTFLPLLNKVRGIPLGIIDETFHKLKQFRAPQQDIDVFWAGRLSSSIRITALTLLKEFATKVDRKIVIAEELLPFEKFCETTARSKITISVEGKGWDCYRHYEAVALGSLPLINRPTREAMWWHDMPEEIYFENDFSNFVLRLEQLLKMDELRKKCLHEMEKLIQRHMLWSRIAEYIVETSMKKVTQYENNNYRKPHYRSRMSADYYR